MKLYYDWKENPLIDISHKQPLADLQESDIKDRFYQELSFGTAGLRGKLGVGTNRMNVYTVAKACEGISRYIVTLGKEFMDKGVAISYDVRHMSAEFAKLSAEILAAHGIRVYLYDSFRTTPLLSYTVLKYNATAGIMVTASHNPKDYNGYKVYWSDGAQINDEVSDAISLSISSVSRYGEFQRLDIDEGIDSGIVTMLGETIESEYLSKVLELSLCDDVDKDINIVYTPLNGTGNIPVRRILDMKGFKNVFVPKEQELPDPDFTTVGYPNPEDSSAFKLSEKLGKEVAADVLIATDPDCDRVAIGVKNSSGEYAYLRGNQTANLLMYYIVNVIDKRKLRESFVVKSIVTSELGIKIAEKYGLDSYQALTGFKNICGIAMDVEEHSEKRFLFGYEESIGYLFGRIVRDKDAVVASMLIAEMLAYFKKKGKSCLTILEEINAEYGYHRDKLIQRILEGSEGKNKMSRIMRYLRENSPMEIAGLKVRKVTDYKYDETGLQKSDVLKFTLENGSWLAVRPSGTEPKIKFYIESISETKDEAESLTNNIEKFVDDVLNKVK